MSCARAATQQFKRRTGRFSEIVRKSAQTSTAAFSSNRLTRRTVRAKKGLTELLLPQSKVRGAPLNDTDLQSNVIDNFCTYLERYGALRERAVVRAAIFVAVCPFVNNEPAVFVLVRRLAIHANFAWQTKRSASTASLQSRSSRRWVAASQRT